MPNEDWRIDDAIRLLNDANESDKVARRRRVLLALNHLMKWAGYQRGSEDEDVEEEVSRAG